MKKFLFIAVLLSAFGLQAGDSLILDFGKPKTQQEQLLAKKSKCRTGWYSTIGRCNIRYGPGENYAVYYMTGDNEFYYVVGRVGKWYKIIGLEGSDDNRIFYTHVQNLRYRGYNPYAA